MKAKEPFSTDNGPTDDTGSDDEANANKETDNPEPKPAPVRQVLPNNQ
jgi:hypothetical protein